MPAPWAILKTEQDLQFDDQVERGMRKREELSDPSKVRNPFGDNAVPRWMIEDGLVEARKKGHYDILEATEQTSGRQHPDLPLRVASDLQKYWVHRYETAPVMQKEAWAADYDMLQQGRLSPREMEGNPLYAARSFESVAEEHRSIRGRMLRDQPMSRDEGKAIRDFEGRLNAIRNAEAEEAVRQGQSKQERQEMLGGFGAEDPSTVGGQRTLKWRNEFSSVYEEIADSIRGLTPKEQVQRVHDAMKERNGSDPDWPAEVGGSHLNAVAQRTGMNFKAEDLTAPVAKDHYDPSYGAEWRSPLSGRTAQQIREHFDSMEAPPASDINPFQPKRTQGEVVDQPTPKFGDLA